MNNYSLPSPSQVNYGVDPVLQSILDEIKNNLSLRTPKFVLTLHSNSQYYSFQNQVNTIIEKFGWKISSKWTGTRENGNSVWTISPL